MRKGVTTPLSTLILIGTLIPIVVATAIFSANMFEIQAQNSEFAYAEDFMVTLAQVVEDISLYPGASSHVRLNSRVGRLNIFYLNGENVTIEIAGSGENFNYVDDPPAIIEYSGGSLASAVDKVLRGSQTDVKIIRGGEIPLGRVVEFQQDGPKIRLDFMRIRVVPVGTVFSDELNKTVMVYEIHYTEIEYGGWIEKVKPAYVKIESANRSAEMMYLTDYMNVTLILPNNQKIGPEQFTADSTDTILAILIVTTIRLTFVGG